jgi:hypothetical protein
MSIEQLLGKLDRCNQIEETVHDLSFELSLRDVNEEEFIDFLTTATQVTELTGGYRIPQVDNGFIAFNGGRLEEQYGEGNEIDLDDLDIDGECHSLLDEFSYYNSSGDIETAAEKLYDLSTLLEGPVAIRGNLSKDAIKEEADQILHQPLQDKFTIEFWYSEDSLNGWLSDQSLEDLVERIFQYDCPPLIVFWSESYDIRAGSMVLQWSDLSELGIQESEDSEEFYREKMRLVRRAGTWHDSLPYLHPDHIRPLQEQLESPVWAHLLIYAVLGSFSDTIERSAEGLQFRIAGEHELVVDTPIEELYDSWGEGGLESVYELYEDFSEFEGEGVFRSIWGRAIAENISDDFNQLPQSSEAIREAQDDLEVEAIRANFDDLGDVIEDTQTLLAELNSRLSSSATQTARQIQGLGFTLVGAILANLFLVLRWSNVDLLPPFSLVVTMVIIVVYLPLIQGRIDDLDTVITEADRDYKLYESSIRRFSEALFPFDQLSDRKAQYLELARKQRDRAQQRISIVFTALIIIWGVLAYVSVSLFPTPSYRAAPTILSIPILIMLSQTPNQPSEENEDTPEEEQTAEETNYWDSVVKKWQHFRVLCSHTDHTYFNRNLVYLLLIFIALVLVLDVVSGTVFPPAEQIFVVKNTTA